MGASSPTWWLTPISVWMLRQVMGLLVLLKYVLKAELGTSQTTLIPSLELPLNGNLVSFPHHSPATRFSMGASLHDHVAAAAHHAAATPAPGFLAMAALTTLGLAEPGSGLRPGLPSLVPGALAASMMPPAASQWVQRRFESTGAAPGAGAWRQADGSAAPHAKTSAHRDTKLYHGPDCLEFFLVSASPAAAPMVGSLTKAGRRQGLLGAMPQKSCTLRNRTKVQVPYFDHRGSASQVELELFNDLTFLNNVSLHRLDDAPPCAAPYLCPAYLTPDGASTCRLAVGVVAIAWLLRLLSLCARCFVCPVDLIRAENSSLSELVLDYTLSVNDNSIEHYHRANNFTRLGKLSCVHE